MGGEKKSEIPAILPRATRGTFVPFFVLHRFGVETYIRGKPGSSAFLRAVHPESKKTEKRKKKKEEEEKEGRNERKKLQLFWSLEQDYEIALLDISAEDSVLRSISNRDKSIGLVGLSDCS